MPASGTERGTSRFGGRIASEGVGIGHSGIPGVVIAITVPLIVSRATCTTIASSKRAVGIVAIVAGHGIGVASVIKVIGSGRI